MPRRCEGVFCGFKDTGVGVAGQCVLFSVRFWEGLSVESDLHAFANAWAFSLCMGWI